MIRLPHVIIAGMFALISVESYAVELMPVLAGLSNTEGEFKKDVPYVPTPTRIVEEMLAMAKVTDKDMLYDLGCGDGRIVITAAQKYKAHGVGIDIDPQRIKESEENAAAAGVKDKVRFVRQDLFKADMKDATVVTLYLLSSVNMKLRPKLLRDLKPGTRVVSHSFDMGDWKPDQSSTASNPVYSWIVPANVSGTWTWRSGGEDYQMELQQRFQQAAGEISLGGLSLPLRSVRLSGDTVQFEADVMQEGKAVSASFSGKAKGDTITGTMKVDGKQEKEWKAKRNPATLKPIDGEEMPTAEAPPQKVI